MGSRTERTKAARWTALVVFLAPFMMLGGCGDDPSWESDDDAGASKALENETCREVTDCAGDLYCCGDWLSNPAVETKWTCQVEILNCNADYYPYTPGDSGGGTCTPDGESCATGPACCSDSLCISYPDIGDYCGFICTSGSDCASGCCVPVEDSSLSVCAAAHFCQSG